MPITHTMDAEHQRLVFTVSGTLTTQEMLAAVDESVRSAGPGKYGVLSDHRAITTPATREQLEALVHHLTRYRAHFGGSRWAVVVGQPASFGMMRMLGVFAEAIPIEVGVFEDLAEATEWLEALSPGPGASL